MKNKKMIGILCTTLAYLAISFVEVNAQASYPMYTVDNSLFTVSDPAWRGMSAISSSVANNGGSLVQGSWNTVSGGQNLFSNITNQFSQIPPGSVVIARYTGHGSTSGFSNYPSQISRDQYMEHLYNEAVTNDLHVIAINEDCYGARACGFVKPEYLEDGRLTAFTGSAGPNSKTNGENGATYFGKIIANQEAIDTNNDGKVTYGEWQKWAQQNDKGNYRPASIGDPEAVLFNRADVAPYPQGGPNPSDKICIILSPGPSKTFGDFTGTDGEDLNIAPAGQEVNCMNLPNPFISPEDPLNQTLRTKQLAPMLTPDFSSASKCVLFYEYIKAKEITESNQDLAKKSAPNAKKTIIPTKDQASEYVANSMKGYTIKEGGATMQPGNSYLAGSNTAKDIHGKNVKIGEDCSFAPMSQEEIDKLKPGSDNPFAGPNNQGNPGSGGGGGGGGPEGLAGKLGELLKGLMSGLGQGGGNQGGQASPSPTPFTCPDMTSPVCGNDGKTYRNSCEAEYKAQVGVKSVGYCPESPLAQCSTTWEPVCGNDNITYSNLCELQNRRTVTKVSSGICPDGIGTESLTALSTVLQNATNTGVPVPLLENAIRTVASLIANLVNNPLAVLEVTVP